MGYMSAEQDNTGRLKNDLKKIQTDE